MAEVIIGVILGIGAGRVFRFFFFRFDASLFGNGAATQRCAAASFHVSSYLLLRGRAQRQAGQTGRQVHVRTDTQHGRVLLHLTVLAFRLFNWEASLHHRFQAVHKQFAAFRSVIVLQQNLIY